MSPGGGWSLAIIALCGAAGLACFHVVNDDAFITFVCARNFAQGHGLVFTPGELVLGTTAPLWAVLLGVLTRISMIDIVILAKTGNIACLMAASWFLGRIVGTRFGPAGAAAVAPAMFFGSPQAWTIGNEIPLLYLCVAVTLWASMNRRLSLALFMSVLAGLTRGEGILLAPVVLWLAHRRGQSLHWRDGAPAAALATLSAVWLLTTYGDLLPNTFVAKTSERYTDWFLSALPEAFRYTFIVSGLWLPVSVIPVTGLVFAAVSLPEETWIWPAVHIAAYTLINASSHPWYYHSLGFAWVVGVATAFGLVAQWLTSKGFAVLSVICVVGPLVCLTTWPEWTGAHPSDYYRFSTYSRVASELERTTQAGVVIAAQEIGVLGYYLPRRIVAIDFLVHRRPSVPFAGRVDWLMTTLRPPVYVTTDLSPLLQYTYPEQKPVVYVRRTIMYGDDDRYPVAVFHRADVDGK